LFAHCNDKKYFDDFLKELVRFNRFLTDIRVSFVTIVIVVRFVCEKILRKNSVKNFQKKIFENLTIVIVVRCESRRESSTKDQRFFSSSSSCSSN
jgi:hypothetical protein